MSAESTAQKGGSSRLAPRALAGLVLFGLWVLLSGKIDAFHLGIGLLSVLAVLWIHYRLPPMEPAAHPQLNPLRFAAYFFWLLLQMLLSAIHVARVILRPGADRLDPRLIAFRSEQPSVVQSVLFANSITLTPGTLTLDLRDGRYLVHALTADTAADLLSGDMAGRVSRLSGPAEGPFLEELSPDDWRLKP